MSKQGDHDGLRRTLAIHLGALGDLVLALPALAALARGGAVEAWGPSRERLSIGLAPRGPFAAVRVLPHELFGEPGDAARLVEGFERVVVFSRAEGPLARNLPGATFLSVGEKGHVSDVLLDGLVERGLVDATAVRHPVLHVPRRDTGLVPLGGDPPIPPRGAPPFGLLVVQPGAGGRAKRWAPERFAEVARRSGRETVCVLGPAELDPPEPSLRFGGRIVEAPPLEELIALLASARVFLGNDAGVTHLAAALGVPTVAVFGPTDPRRWAPRGRGRVSVIRAPEGDLSRLGVEPVLEAVVSFDRDLPIF